MKKHILCLLESLGSGGAERQLTGLAVMLKQQGYEVEVWYYVKNEFYLPYLQENRLDKWTHNKTIQKAIESYRITPEQKAELKALRRSAE